MLVPLSCSEPPQTPEASPGRAAEEGALPAASIAEILRAVRREVADAGQSACDLQTTLSGVAQALGQQDRAVEAFQALDLLTQRLQGVAAFLDALAPTLPICWVGDAAAAAQAVTMSDLARRLARPLDDLHHAKSEDAGAFEFF